MRIPHCHKAIGFLFVLWAIAAFPPHADSISSAPQADVVISLDDDIIEAVRSGSAPDTCIAFSPDESNLAIASFGGWLRIVNTESGQVVWKTRVPEGLIRSVAYSQDGSILFAGELSPDAYLVAFNAMNGHQLWRYRTADDLGSAPLPADKNRFSIYGLPGVYHIEPMDSGAVLFSAFHSTFARDGRSGQKGHLYSMTPEGRVKWKFPSNSPYNGNIAHFSLSGSASRLALGISGETGVRQSAVISLDSSSGTIDSQHTLAPFEPYFKLVFFWRSVSVSPAGNLIAASANDGRLFIFETDKTPNRDVGIQSKFTSQTLTLVQPIEVGGTHLVALAGWCLAGNDIIIVQSQQTIAPQGTSISGDNPPLPHPQSNRVFALAPDSETAWETKWTWAGDGDLNGLSADQNFQRILVVQTGIGRTAASDDWLGGEGVVLDMRDSSGALMATPTVTQRIPVLGEMNFNSVLSPSGRLAAIIETPHWIKSQDKIAGHYQVVIRTLPE